MLQEKRQHERAGAFLIVQFRQRGEEDEYSHGISRDFSADGLSFDSQKYHHGPGEILECVLKHPETDLSVSVQGAIIWKKESWYKCVTGLKFIGIEENDRSRIIKLISPAVNIPGPPFPGCDADILTTGNGPEKCDKRPDDKTAVTEHIQSVDIKTGTSRRRQKRSVKDRIIRDDQPAAAARQKKSRNVMLVMASIIILAVIMFLASRNSKKDIPAVTASPSTGNPSHLTEAGNSRDDNLPGILSEPEQMRAAATQDNLPENKDMPVEQPVIKQEDHIAAGTPVPVLAVQRDDEAGSSAENPSLISPDASLPVDKDHKRTEEGAQANFAKEPRAGSPASGNNTEDHSVENKTPVPPEKRVKVYEESFDNNAGKWDIFNTGMAAARIEAGEYRIQNKRKTGAHIIFHHSDFPFNKDFTLEAPIRLVKGSVPHSYGFVLGAKDARNNVVFQVNAAGSFSIRQYHEGAVRELKGGKAAGPAIMRDSANTLKVVRQGGDIRFYINDALAAEVSGLSFSGSKTGFIIEGESEIAVDKIRSQLNE